MTDKTEKGKSVFIRGGESGGEVREGAAESTKGDARLRGVYVLGWGGGGLGPPTKAFLLRTLWIPEDQVVLTMNASMKPHCLCPREAESSQD